LETALKATISQDVYQRGLLVKTAAGVHDRVYADIADDREIFNKQRMAAKTLMELQSDSFVEKQRKTL
jgi:hypothetical protein